MLTIDPDMSAIRLYWPRDQVLAGAFAVLTPENVLRACRESGDQDVTAAAHCRMIEALYHPSRYVRIAYALTADAYTPLERCWPEGTIVYLHHPVRHPVSRRGRLVQIDGRAFELYQYPNDRRLRGLRKFTARASAIGTWQSWIRRAGGEFELVPDSLRRTLIRYVPEQKWIARLRARRIGVEGRAGKVSIAVRSSAPRALTQLRQRHDLLTEFAARGDLRFAVPATVGTDVSAGLLAVTWVRGESLLDALRAGSAESTLAQVAEGLASLHRLRLPGLHVLRPADLVQELLCIRADLVACSPEHASAASAVVDDACRRLDRPQPARKPATLHADFHWKQLRAGEQGLALLDFERLCTGDALVDVANFATQLELLGARPQIGVSSAEGAAWARGFLSLVAEDFVGTGDRENMAGLCALSALRLARGALRHLWPGWPTLAGECIAHAQRVLCAPGEGAWS